MSNEQNERHTEQPIGAVAVALRAMDAPLGVVVGAWVLSAAVLATGVSVLLFA